MEKTISQLTDRELLERVLTSSLIIFKKVERIEKYLAKNNEEKFYEHDHALDDFYEEVDEETSKFKEAIEKFVAP